MLATQEAHAARVTSCSICQRSVRVNPLKATDAGVICRCADANAAVFPYLQSPVTVAVWPTARHRANLACVSDVRNIHRPCTYVSCRRECRVTYTVVCS